MNDSTAQRLSRFVVEPLKHQFVGRDEVVDLIALAVVAGEHLFLLGPPGTAKSLLVRQFSQRVNCRYFEYLLTRFSEPNELFGPVDLVRLREGVVATVTREMLPEAEFAFLDELFNANSAILNNLLMVLNERIYRRGAETHQLPLMSVFAASNQLPEETALQALFDRFLLRCRVDALPGDLLPQLLMAGWNLEGAAKSELGSEAPSAEELRALHRQVKAVRLQSILPAYSQAVQRIRDLGIQLSDRRAVKILKLIAASAVLCGRDQAQVSDLWVLRYVWDRSEQITPLANLVNGLLQSEPQETDNPIQTSSQSHPRAALPEAVDPEQLATELEQLQGQITGSLKLMEIARLKEHLQAIADKAAWIEGEKDREFLLKQIRELQEKLG